MGGRFVDTVRTLAFFALLGGLAACATTPAPGQAEDETPAVVLVSLDGFRWDYATLTETPALDRLAREGMQAEALQPVFPTLTFPNHYSIATGVLPGRHGIVANRFPDAARRHWYSLSDREAVQDGRWYLAEPVWVTAEKAGLRTAAFFFVGTEADIGGVRPGRWRDFDADVPDGDRVDQVLAWLAEPPAQRPQLVTLYFEVVDDHGHWYGPEAAETRAAIRGADAQLGRLLAGIAALPRGDDVHVIVVSDHGQGRYGPQQPFVLEDWVDLTGTDVVSGGAYARVHFAAADPERARSMQDAINSNWDCGQALLPEELPSGWRAGLSPRFPDLFVQPDAGCAVITRASDLDRLTAGDHGWTPDNADMWGIFYAAGPRIPAGSHTGRVSVLDVYPLLLDLLGLEAPGPIDGDPRALASRLLPVSE